LTDSTTPLKSLNGPSVTRTTSPGSKSTFGRGFSAPSSTRRRIALASRSVIGAGFSGVPPMNPSTFGVSFTRCQVSSSISICTST